VGQKSRGGKDLRKFSIGFGYCGRQSSPRVDRCGEAKPDAICVFYVKCIGVHCLPGTIPTVPTLGPRTPDLLLLPGWGFSPQVHIGFGKFRLPGTTGPNKIRPGSAETAVGMTLSPEGNRVRCAAVEGGVEHGFVEISPDKIYKYAKHINVPVACPQQNLSLPRSVSQGAHFLNAGPRCLPL
jgi:hypothetical protein